MDAHIKISENNRIVEILSFLALLGVFFPLFFLSKMGEGEVLPIHFNIMGKADDWGVREFLWFLPLISVVIYTGLSFLGRYSRKLKKQNGTTRANLLCYMKLFVLLIFAYINNVSYLIATEKMVNLNSAVIIILLGGLFFTVLVFAIKIKKTTKKT